MQFMRDDPQLLSKRLQRFVEPLTAKELAQRIDCDVRTAENIRRGHWPIARHWFGLIAVFGEDLTEAVFHPEKAAARLAREVAELEAELAKKRATLRDVQGDSSGVAKVRARPEDGSAEVIGPPPRP